MKPVRAAIWLPAVVLVLLIVGVTVASAADEDENLIRKTDIKALNLPMVSPDEAAAGQAGKGVGPGQQGRQSTYCGSFGEAGRGAFDKDISCDDPFAPDNETPIAVNPANPQLLLAGSNDYQINFVGSTLNEQVPSGWMLSQDGGSTWIDGSLPLKGDLGGGDPAPAFDVKRNRAVFASLSFVCGQLARFCSRGNVMFATADLSKLSGKSTDTLQWSDQTIANGSGSDTAQQQLFLDKEYVAVDNNSSSPFYGNYYVVYSQFRTEHLQYDESPIMFTMSSDGGNHWTQPVEISGRNPTYCQWQDDANDPDTSASGNNGQGTSEGPDDPVACDQNGFAYPAVAPDGTVYVQWDNEQNLLAYELPQRYDSQVLLVRSSDGGQTWSGETPTAANQNQCVRFPGQAAGSPTAGFSNPCVIPTHIVNKEDSYDTAQHGNDGTPFPDYPLNVQGRITLTDHQFRVNSAGTIAIGHPAGGLASQYRIYSVWSDNCDGVRPGPGQTHENPGSLPGGSNFVPVTNTNVDYAYSDDGGQTWVGGDSLGASCVGRLRVNASAQLDDQWFPWAAANPNTGALSVGYMDEAFDGPNNYGFSIATSSPLVLGTPPAFPAPVKVDSVPSQPNNALYFRADVPGCETCATFIGDYNGLAVGSDNAVHGTWTDMRRQFIPGNPNSAVQDAFYARIPPPGP